MKKHSSSYFSLIGFPDDIGIRNVSGRPGAAFGPTAFRQAFHRLDGKNAEIRTSCVQDFDLSVTEDLEANHLEAERDVFSAPDSRIVVIGGGHDYAAPWIQGLRRRTAKAKGKALGKVGCLNIDAHFDLRSDSPLMTSGSPFYRLIEECKFPPALLTEFGIQEHCNQSALWEYAAKKKIRCVPWSKLRRANRVASFAAELRRLSAKCDAVALSLDLDAMSFAYAPGVSSPQAEGFTASEIFEMLEIAGKNKKVVSLGVFELCPSYDVHDLTARLAAQAVWHFLK